MLTDYVKSIEGALEMAHKAEELIAYHAFKQYKVEAMKGKQKAWGRLKSMFAIDIPILKRLVCYYEAVVVIDSGLPRVANGISPQVIGAIAIQFGKGNLTQEAATALCNEAIDARYTLQSVKELLRDNKPSYPLVTQEQADRALGEARDYLGGSIRLDVAVTENMLAASKPFGVVKRYLAQAAKREGVNDEP